MVYNPNMSNPSSSDRRSFLTRFHAGAAAAIAFTSVALAQTKPAAPFVPARHEKDDWMDVIGSKHRMVIDTTSTAGFSDGTLFANNFLLANRNDYGLQNADIGVIVVARHLSTGYGFNDAMWAKYGAQLGDQPAPGAPAKEAPKTNPSARSITNLAGQGVHFAICAMATRRLAGQIAGTGGNVDAIVAELSANTVANGHMVAAGIIAVNRAQERGFTAVKA